MSSVIEITPEQQDTSRKRGPSQATLLVQLASQCELFHDSDGDEYAALQNNDHRECWLIRSKGFRDWLAHQFYQNHEKAPSGQALTDAINTLGGKALFKGSVQAVYLRVGEFDGNLYLDLTDEQWRAVEIRPNGWQIIQRCPVNFTRRKGMLPLPAPISGGKINRLLRQAKSGEGGSHVDGQTW